MCTSCGFGTLRWATQVPLNRLVSVRWLDAVKHSCCRSEATPEWMLVSLPICKGMSERRAAATVLIGAAAMSDRLPNL